jgi:uncharacterized membrane protein YsdA (DUF1294 family)
MRVLAAVGIGYAAKSAITTATYAFDKRAARRGDRRIPETTLHLLELLGGWPAFDVLRDVAQSINPWVWLRYVSFGLLA